MSGASAEAAPLERWCGEPLRVWGERWGVPAVEAYERIGSTNDRARELAAGDAEPFSVVIALEQTRGRGRRGATWHSPAGSGLWMSVLLPGGPGLHLPLLVGLAAAEAVQDLSPALRVGIEWPNDLVVRGKKLGGILCEGAPTGVVAGIGINVETPTGGFPAGLEDRATSLEAEGVKQLSHSDLAGHVVRGLKRHLARPEARIAPAALAALGQRDALAARAVLSETEGAGTARGIDPDGALVLERADGSRVRVLAGSVRPV